MEKIFVFDLGNVINAYCVTGDTIKDLILREKFLK